MNIDDIFVANLEGESKFILTVKEQPNIFGVIEKEYNKERSKEIFSIKYYWNKVYQDTLYADTLEDAKDKLKDVLMKVMKQTKIMTFEQFKY